MNGLDCNCFCPECKHPLIAKNSSNNIKTAHFAHNSGKECEGAFETTLHLLAKEVLLNTKRILIPKYHFDYDPLNSKSIFRKDEEILFDNISLEKTIAINGKIIIADAIGQIKNKSLIIEFANTHFINFEKKELIKKSGIASIEINLKGQILDFLSLDKFFNTDTPLKYWITNLKSDNDYNAYKIQEIELEKGKLLKLQNEKENRKITNEIKRRKYEENKSFNHLKVKNGRAFYCPYKKIELGKLKTNIFYTHPVLKEIIDGKNWNEDIYGNSSYGISVYVNDKKVIVYPPNSIIRNDSFEEERLRILLYKGLNCIKDILGSPIIGDCINCKNYIDKYFIEENEIRVCGYYSDTKR